MNRPVLISVIEVKDQFISVFMYSSALHPLCRSVLVWFFGKSCAIFGSGGHHQAKKLSPALILLHTPISDETKVISKNCILQFLILTFMKPQWFHGESEYAIFHTHHSSEVRPVWSHPKSKYAFFPCEATSCFT